MVWAAKLLYSMNEQRGMKDEEAEYSKIAHQLLDMPCWPMEVEEWEDFAYTVYFDAVYSTQ